MTAESGSSSAAWLPGGRRVTTAVTVEERLGVGSAGGADKLEWRGSRGREMKESSPQEVRMS